MGHVYTDKFPSPGLFWGPLHRKKVASGTPHPSTGGLSLLLMPILIRLICELVPYFLVPGSCAPAGTVRLWRAGLPIRSLRCLSKPLGESRGDAIFGVSHVPSTLLRTQWLLANVY